MEGIYIVIAIIIALFNITAKQQKNRSRGQSGINKPSKRQIRMPQWSGGSFTDLGKSLNEMFGETEEHYEGMELEDRRRTGSLDNIEQSRSSEGTCDEHPEQHKKLDALRDEIIIAEDDDFVFEITEDNLINSIIMAEVLGPPRAMKRGIR